MAKRQRAVSITGIAELDRAFQKFAVNTQRKHLREGAKVASKFIAKDAKALAPRDTGQLESSIKSRALPRSRTHVGYAVAAAPKGWRMTRLGGSQKKAASAGSESRKSFHGKVFYGVFHELGTKKLKKDPFLRPALYSNASLVLHMFQNAVRKSIREAARPG